MNFEKTVKVENCKYYDYTYRLPVVEKNVSFIPVEEDLTANERYINALAGIDMKSIVDYTPKSISVIDCEFVVSHVNQDWLVELFLKPSAFTLAKEPIKIKEWVFAYWYVFDKSNYNKTLDETFFFKDLLFESGIR